MVLGVGRSGFDFIFSSSAEVSISVEVSIEQSGVQWDTEMALELI